MPNGSETKTKIESYLLARIPFVSVRTVEQARVRDMLTEIAPSGSSRFWSTP